MWRGFSGGAILQTKRARIYLDPANVLPHPGDRWTRFVCISDTHDCTPAVPDGDVLLHAGDISGGIPSRMKTMFEWLRGLPHQTKVVIAGNHDNWKIGGFMGRMGFTDEVFDELQEVVRGEDTRKSRVHYLEYESLEVEVRGKAAARHSFGAFQYETKDEAADIYSKIPDDTEILLTHTPAEHILDETKREVRAGCGVLAERLKELVWCRLHVFGHIHEARGAEIGEGGNVHVNAAIGSRMGGNPVVVDLLNSLEVDSA
ncbi:Metallo-dependent phosphatase-like protein [Thelephora terrestris]|uniref:Metallo-dependent phosphatase-like protein n=1 Tax=Thelephora terrestris TaxID=56493 RepID=A0A9P6HTU1_9AGAM|nr:Metallo-dependent phosphatase-like protein [Thelephora terrestris]